METLNDFLNRLRGEFSLTPWNLVECVVENAFSAYGGSVSLAWEGSRNYGCTASIKIEANVDDDANNNSGEGVITWTTSSDHIVKIYTIWVNEVWDKTLSERLIWTGWYIEKVQMGDDPSETFYPVLTAIANDCGVETEAIPLQIMAEDEQKETGQEE